MGIKMMNNKYVSQLSAVKMVMYSPSHSGKVQRTLVEVGKKEGGA